jgi:hypothetical protein
MFNRCEKVLSDLSIELNNFAVVSRIALPQKTYHMAKEIKSIALAEDAIISKIYLIRGHKVMIDRDLAELYGVETKQLKRQVRRNIDRFPGDFMFELSAEEFQEWRSQFGASKEGDKMGLRYAPYVFTEQGVAMLSTVLNSERAIKVNIQIMRIYTKMREMLMTNLEILLKLEQMERKVSGHDDDIQLIFKYLKQLLNPPEEPRPRVGFRRKDEQN